MWKEMDLTWLLFAGILSVLALLSIVGQVLKHLLSGERQIEMLEVVNARVRIWWAMCGVFTIAAFTRGIGSILVFALTSFLLLREFITMAPTRKGDHRSLFWVFFVILPLHYYQLWIGWYGMFIILIPVYAFLLVPLRMALSGDARGFLERASKIQWALMICVYCISHAPALLKVDFLAGSGVGLRLLLFLCLIVQVNDLTQLLVRRGCGHLAGLADIEQSGRGRLVAGLLVSAAMGMSLCWATPFSLLQAAGLSVLIALMGTAGNFCYAAIMKDRGKPGVVVVQTRPSMTERVISLCFAAPIFFHIVRYFFSRQPPITF